MQVVVTTDTYAAIFFTTIFTGLLLLNPSPCCAFITSVKVLSYRTSNSPSISKTTSTMTWTQSFNTFQKIGRSSSSSSSTGRSSSSPSPSSTTTPATMMDCACNNNNDNDDDNNNNNNNNNDNSFYISLWLLPDPTEKAHEILTNTIQSYSKKEESKDDETSKFNRSVPFDPHVTIIGSIPCSSKTFLFEQLIPKLKEGIIDFIAKNTTLQNNNNNNDNDGIIRIPCHLKSQPVYKPKWNQACVLVMEEPSKEFIQLVQLCREIIAIVLAGNVNDNNDSYDNNNDNETKTTAILPKNCFPPPLCQPHLSLYYGDADGVPSSDDVMKHLSLLHNNEDNNGSITTGTQKQETFSFNASQIAIWKTHPASIEGVAQWKKLHVIDLASSFISSK